MGFLQLGSGKVTTFILGLLLLQLSSMDMESQASAQRLPEDEGKKMASEPSEGGEERKIMGGNQQLSVHDDLLELGKKAAWSISSCKSGNGVASLRDDSLDSFWQLPSFPSTNDHRSASFFCRSPA